MQLNFTSVKQWYNRPISFFDSTPQKILIPIIVSLFVYVVSSSLVVNENNDLNIRYSDIDKITQNNFLDFSLICLFVLVFYAFVLPIIFRKINRLFLPRVKYFITYFLISIATICVLDVIYYYLVTGEDLTFNRMILLYLDDLYQSTVTGAVPLIICLYWMEKNHLRSKLKNIRKAELQQNTNEHKSNKTILIISSNQKHYIEIDADDLFVVKSDGNYCHIFYQEHTKQKKMLMRVTLKKVEESLINYQNFIRCHKSYLVNLDKVAAIDKNKNQHWLIIESLDIQVPVSRNLTKKDLNILLELSVVKKTA